MKNDTSCRSCAVPPSQDEGSTVPQTDSACGNHDWLLTLCASVPAGIMLVDAQTHRIVEINPKALQMIGATRDEVIGKVCHNFVCTAEVGSCPITDLGQVIDNSEREMLTADNRRIPILKTVAPVLHEGRPHLIESFLDISRLKETQADLAKSEERYRELFDNAHDMINIVGRDGRFLFANPAWQKALGYTADEIQKTTFAQLVPKYLQKSFNEEYMRLLQEGRREQLETVFQAKDGRRIPVEGIITRRHENSTEEVQCIWRDITERKRAAEQLEEWNQRLADEIEAKTRQLIETQGKLIQSEKLAAVGQLVSGAAHELSNPISGILNAVQFLKKQKQHAPLDPELMDELNCLDEVEKATLRCQGVLDKLCNFAEPAVSEFWPSDINQLLRDAIKIFENESPRNDIRISKKFRTRLPQIEVDAVQMVQVFHSIITNAAQSMPSGGMIEIETGLLDTADQSQPKLYVNIKDTGCGIAQNIMSKIFDPFFTTRQPGQAKGLGLTLSYGIVEKHHGDIVVESTEGEGTLVKIRLPLSQPQPD